MKQLNFINTSNMAISPDERAFFAQLGTHIAELRKQNGITQVQLAEALNVSQQTVTSYEVARRRVPVSALPILAELFGIEINCDYGQRIEQVSRLPLILWDTIRTCHREGSLDSNIQKHQLEANDIPALLNQYPTVALVVFNGATSEKYFRRLVKSELPEESGLAFMKMPSTSPANAGSSFEQKLAAWSELLHYL
jgi:hypoxanthine-DNA glycosylase